MDAETDIYRHTDTQYTDDGWYEYFKYVETLKLDQLSKISNELRCIYIQLCAYKNKIFAEQEAFQPHITCKIESRSNRKVVLTTCTSYATNAYPREP